MLENSASERPQGQQETQISQEQAVILSESGSSGPPSLFPIQVTSPVKAALPVVHPPIPSSTGYLSTLYSFFPKALITSTGVKRKGGVVKGSKRKKKTIIDDEGACSVFRGLHLGNDFLNSGKLLAWALTPNDKAFLPIHDYVSRGQNETKVKILSILRIVVNASNLYKDDDDDKLNFNEDPNAKGKLRMMLWHGTRKRNLTSILENGLRLPMLHRQWFGAGIYFADRISKCIVFTDYYWSYGQTRSYHISYLFFCDVLLDKMYEIQVPMSNIVAPPAGYDSIKGIGENIPDKTFDKDIDGSVWPLGNTIKNKEDVPPFCLMQENEYIVFNTKQVQPKYLVKVKIGH